MKALAIPSGATTLNAVLYIAAGRSPHPTVLLSARLSRQRAEPGPCPGDAPCRMGRPDAALSRVLGHARRLQLPSCPGGRRCRLGLASEPGWSGRRRRHGPSRRRRPQHGPPWRRAYEAGHDRTILGAGLISAAGMNLFEGPRAEKVKALGEGVRGLHHAHSGGNHARGALRGGGRRSEAVHAQHLCRWSGKEAGAGRQLQRRLGAHGRKLRGSCHSCRRRAPGKCILPPTTATPTSGSPWRRWWWIGSRRCPERQSSGRTTEP